MRIREKIDGKFYTSKLPYPERLREPVLRDLKGKPPEEQIRLMDEHKKALEEYPRRRDAYQTAIKAHNEDEARLREEFKRDLFEELEISNNPRREKFWDKVWSQGHSSGLNEVLSIAEELVDLIL